MEDLTLLILKTRWGPDLAHGKNVGSTRTRIFFVMEAARNAGSPKTKGSAKEGCLVDRSSVCYLEVSVKCPESVLFLRL